MEGKMLFTKLDEFHYKRGYDPKQNKHKRKRKANQKKANMKH